MSFTSMLGNSEQDEQVGLLRDLQEAYRAFTYDKVSLDPIRHFRRGSRSFLGVSSKLEGNVDLWDLRQDLLGEIKCKEASILQVVGDSGVAFREQSISRALQILSEEVTAECIVQYGYTAMKHDTNWLVAEHIQKSSDRGSRTIANVVEQSIECLQDPRWRGSLRVTNFVVLYDHDRSTNFGDDVWLSDGIMFAGSDDKMLCFEGGLQAFRQCVNMLLKGIQVTAVTGLRSEDTPARFSAAHLLECLKIADESAMRSQADKYLEKVFSKDAQKLRIAEGLVNSLLATKCDWRSLISILLVR